jgi:hypothetical protein
VIRYLIAIAFSFVITYAQAKFVHNTGVPPVAISFTPGGLDVNGHFMGGTEMRGLVPHAGKMYACNGYWVDNPGPEGVQNFQVLELDGPQSQGYNWFQEFNAGTNELACSTMGEYTFTTDYTGSAVNAPTLLMGDWNNGPSPIPVGLYAFDDGAQTWTRTTVASEVPAGGAPQIRAISQPYIDTLVSPNVSTVYLGEAPTGIFPCTYNAAIAGKVQCSSTPEFVLSEVPFPANGYCNTQLRPTSFAVANGTLYVAICQQIYARTNGPQSTCAVQQVLVSAVCQQRWNAVFTNPNPKNTNTGFRGITAVPHINVGSCTSGTSDLLVVTEGSGPIVWRYDPTCNVGYNELGYRQFVATVWGMQPLGYMIGAYSNVPLINGVWWIGIEAFVPSNTQTATNHFLWNVTTGGGNSGMLDSGAWYLTRDALANYQIEQIPYLYRRPVVSTRVIATSPFGDGNMFMGGFDANGGTAPQQLPTHNTSWIVVGSIGSMTPNPGVCVPHGQIFDTVTGAGTFSSGPCSYTDFYVVGPGGNSSGGASGSRSGATGGTGGKCEALNVPGLNQTYTITPTAPNGSATTVTGGTFTGLLKASAGGSTASGAAGTAAANSCTISAAGATIVHAGGATGRATAGFSYGSGGGSPGVLSSATTYQGGGTGASGGGGGAGNVQVGVGPAGGGNGGAGTGGAGGSGEDLTPGQNAVNAGSGGGAGGTDNASVGQIGGNGAAGTEWPCPDVAGDGFNSGTGGGGGGGGAGFSTGGNGGNAGGYGAVGGAGGEATNGVGISGIAGILFLVAVCAWSHN